MKTLEKTTWGEKKLSNVVSSKPRERKMRVGEWFIHYFFSMLLFILVQFHQQHLLNTYFTSGIVRISGDTAINMWYRKQCGERGDKQGWLRKWKEKSRDY